VILADNFRAAPIDPPTPPGVKWSPVYFSFLEICMVKRTLRVESLSDRCTPSATLAGGVLTITGTEGRDAVVVTQQADGTISVRGQTISVVT